MLENLEIAGISRVAGIAGMGTNPGIIFARAGIVKFTRERWFN